MFTIFRKKIGRFGKFDKRVDQMEIDSSSEISEMNISRIENRRVIF